MSLGLSQPSDTPGSFGSATPAEDYRAALRAAAHDPQQLEDLYRTARSARARRQFMADISACLAEEPANVLYQAWGYRLTRDAQEAPRAWLAHWRLAVPLSATLAVTLWLLSSPRWVVERGIPFLAVLWAPVTSLFLIAFLVVAARRHIPRSAVVCLALAALTGYVLVEGVRVGPVTRTAYLDLMLAHLPLVAWGAVGIAVLGWRSSARERFAFLTKSIETIGTAGVASIAGGIFVGLTYGMFAALSVAIPDVLTRLLLVGGAGLIPLLAVAAVYDPTLAPSAQDFRRGFGTILSILMRALLPLTLVVLVIYLGFIPFNFMQPFTNRDVLIVYNVLLFAILGLLIGVTPVEAEDVPERFQAWLRAGIVALASLVIVVSLYALAAIIYRTVNDHLTMNRIVVIGWNLVNITILVLVLANQMRAGRGGWVAAVQAALRVGTTLYLAWGVALVLALPWLF